MRFDILTLFPDMFKGVLDDSILGRAAGNGVLKFNFVNIRDFSTNKHKNTDFYPYGGGMGMVMSPQPICDGYNSIAKEGEKPFTIYMSPQGVTLTQKLAKEIAQLDRVVILCGHYEGIDQRVIEEIVDIEVSVGDYVLTGGEIPAMTLIDCVSRMVEGVLPSEDAYVEESHYSGLLEYPHYTRPAEYNGKKVPEILISGHHAKIEKWRRKQSLLRTWLRRPDMLRRLSFTKEDKKFIDKLKNRKRKVISKIDIDKVIEEIEKNG